jgi:hypothetical protein
MGGFIRKREILAHPAIVIRAFGFRVFVMCLLSRGNVPFLTILAKMGRI